MADYDAGEVTDRERKAAENQKAIAQHNVQATKNQLAQQLGNYDFANRQNRRLADVQLKQNSRKTEADRFDAMRNLRNATTGLLGSMNQAMNGSSVGNLLSMLDDRMDKDNMTYWTQHQVNQNAVENAYDEAVNQNNVAKMDAIANAEQAIKGMEADLSANLNNINPNLYEAPGTGSANLDADYASRQRIGENQAKLSGYLMPDNSRAQARRIQQPNKVQRNDYFGRLLNGFNNR